MIFLKENNYMQKNIPTIDLHQDLLLHINHPELYKQKNQTSFNQLIDSNIKIAVVTAYPYEIGLEYDDYRNNDLISNDLCQYQRICSSDSRFIIIKNKQDIVSVKNSDVHGLLLHIEGLNAFNGSQEDWDLLNYWHSLGLRSIGIVWNKNNLLGGGTLDSSKGLTPLGAQVIEWASSNGCIIDLAHMNKKTFADVCRIVTKPLLVSHGNVADVLNNPRNYSANQLKHIARSNGTIGIFVSSRFVSDNKYSTFRDLIKHIDFLRSCIGIDHISIGTDLGGIITETVQGFESLHRMQNFWDFIMKNGYSYDDVYKIAYSNALRVITEYLE